MKCRKAERWILRSLDGVLKDEKRRELERHMSSCLLCQQREKEYRSIFDVLKKEFPSEPLPYFWERLQAKLRERGKYAPWSLWQKWSLRAIPFFLTLIVLLGAAMIFLPSWKKEELSQSEILLLQNVNPLQETRTLFEEEELENRNMMLIFTAMEEKNNIGRYLP
jgi:anti-sigma factor RsiW